LENHIKNIKTEKTKIKKSLAKYIRRRPAKHIVEEVELEIKTKIIDSSSSDSEVELENYINRITRL
jgi:ribosomal protein L31E